MDVFLHFGVSLVVTLVLASMFPRYRWGILLLVLAVGMLKELTDVRADERDMISNLFGTMAAIAGMGSR